MQVFLSPLFDDYFENSSVQTTPTLYQKNSNIISNLSLATHILLHQLFKLQPTAMQYAWRTLAPQPTAPTFCHVTLAQWVPPIHLAACLPRQLLADDLTNGCDSFPSVWPEPGLRPAVNPNPQGCQGLFVNSLYWLVGGFNPFEKHESNWIILSGRGENKRCLKPRPSWGWSSHL